MTIQVEGQVRDSSSKRSLENVLVSNGERAMRTHAAAEPWVWRSGAPVDLELQATCYEAMFRTFWHRPWFAGTHIWKWFPEGSIQFGGRRERRRERGFTPQGKPAEKVVARWYRGAGVE